MHGGYQEEFPQRKTDQLESQVSGCLLTSPLPSAMDPLLFPTRRDRTDMVPSSSVHGLRDLKDLSAFRAPHAVLPCTHTGKQHTGVCLLHSKARAPAIHALAFSVHTNRLPKPV
jgi:hypothetical protein